MNQTPAKRPCESGKAPDTITYGESSLLLEKLSHVNGTYFKQRNGVRNVCIATLMLDAGLRVGEVVGLTIEDLYFNSQPRTSLLVRAEIAKGHSKRIIPLSARLRACISVMEKHWWGRTTWYPDEPAFSATLAGKAITARQVQRIIQTAAHLVLGKYVHPHVLRHTFATRLMRTTSARIVQELLGHKQLTSTQVYTHPNSDDLHRAINSLAGN